MAESQKKRDHAQREGSEAAEMVEEPSGTPSSSAGDQQNELADQIDSATQQVRALDAYADSVEEAVDRAPHADVGVEAEDRTAPDENLRSNDISRIDNTDDPAEQAEAAPVEQATTQVDASVKSGGDAIDPSSNDRVQEQPGALSAVDDPGTDPAVNEAPPEPANVEQLDTSLAENLDSLLDGEFESVDAVLDGVFDEHAQVVSEHDDTGHDDTGSGPDVALLDDEPESADAAPEPAGAADHDESADASSTVDQQSEDEPSEAWDDESEDSQTSASADTAAPVDTSRPTGEQMNDDGRVMPGEPNANAETPAPVVAEQIQQQSDPSSTSPGGSVREAASAGSIFSSAFVVEHVVPIVKSALAAVNAPLRLLPAPVRAVVDWVALSLIFWVPIIWALVLFVM